MEEHSCQAICNEMGEGTCLGVKTVEFTCVHPWQMPEGLLHLDNSHESLQEKNGHVAFKGRIPQPQCCQCTPLLVSHSCQTCSLLGETCLLGPCHTSCHCPRGPASLPHEKVPFLTAPGSQGGTSKF